MQCFNTFLKNTITEVIYIYICKLSLASEIWYFLGGGDSQSTKVFKLQKKVVRLICNVKRKTSCRELFKTLNILPVPCVYIMETVYYIKVNKKGLKQNLAIHDYETRHRSDFKHSFVELIFLKRVYLIWGQNCIIGFQII